MAVAPPLTWMAGIAALADLLVNRVLIFLGHGMWTNDALVRLDLVGGFVRNLSVVAGLVVLAISLASLASRRSGLPLSARAGITGFGWVLIPIVTLMTVLPLALTRPELVLVLAGLAHALILLLVLAGLHRRSSPGMVTSLILILVASLSGLASMATTLMGRRFFWSETERLANAFHWSGELAFLTVPLATAFVLAVPWGTARGKLALLASAVVAAAVAVGMAAWQRVVGDALPTAIYAALRLDLLPDRLAVLYAIPLGIGWAVTIAATLSKDPRRRQLGAALMLLLGAGYAPLTPTSLILTVVAVALLARSATALGRKPVGR